MRHLGINEVGEIIRKVRKERGLRLEDLADENISPATISNLERGVPHVRQDKLAYLLEKLDISMDRLPDLMLGEQKRLEDLKFCLIAVESMQRMGQLDEALAELDRLYITDDHPYAAEISWLRGVCYLFKKDLKRAERQLFNAVRLSSHSNLAKVSNVEAYSFSDLSLCSYYRNDFQSALKFTESGLDAFNPEGDRMIVKYILLRNKATYLERMGRIAEGLQVVQETWEELSVIEKMETVLGFYWLRAELLRRSGALDDAIRYAREGIQLASLNYDHKGVFDLWTVLGSICTTKKDWDKAETCFQIAMGIPREHINDNNRLIRACIQMGQLYIHREKWTEAKQILGRAIEEAEELNNTAYLADAFLAMGDCCFNQMINEEAVSHYRRAVELSQRYHYKDKEYQAWHRLAKHFEGVDEEEFKQCTVNMFRVQEILNQQQETGDYHEVG